MAKPVKLYLAILNHGWLRREDYRLIDILRKSPHIDLTLEEPSLTWANPNAANRNRILKRFLKTDCEWVMQKDDDVTALFDPAELVVGAVENNLPVVGAIAKVRSTHREIDWVAYVKPEGRDGYVAVDFDRMDSQVDFVNLKNGAIGTGCILIRRDVILEILAKHPGTWPFDYFWKDGESEYGVDFGFCIRAAECGHDIWATTPASGMICEHFKELGMLDVLGGYDDSDGRDPSSARYAMPWGDWAISQKDWHFIKDILNRENIKTVLEFGAGLSSLLMSESCDVTSFETDPKWIEEINSKRNGNRLYISEWDGKELPVYVGKKFDLAFVDGPIGKSSGGPGREHSIRLASELSDRVIVHDAGRFDEMHWQQKYLRRKFHLRAKSGLHMIRCHYWERRKDS